MNLEQSDLQQQTKESTIPELQNQTLEQDDRGLTDKLSANHCCLQVNLHRYLENVELSMSFIIIIQIKTNWQAHPGDNINPREKIHRSLL